MSSFIFACCLTLAACNWSQIQGATSLYYNRWNLGSEISSAVSKSWSGIPVQR